MDINELIGYIMVVLVGGALLVTTCAMIVQCAQNCRFLRAYRRDLAQRTNNLRIRKMLGCLGINTRGYVRKAFSSDVEVHLNKCRQCSATTECDAALARSDTSRAGAFCPNFPDLLRFAKNTERPASRT